MYDICSNIPLFYKDAMVPKLGVTGDLAMIYLPDHVASSLVVILMLKLLFNVAQ